MDVFLFGGSISLGETLFIAVIIIGVIGLNLSDNKEEKVAMKGAA